MRKNLNYEAPCSELWLATFEKCILSGNGDAPGGTFGGLYGDDIDRPMNTYNPDRP